MRRTRRATRPVEPVVQIELDAAASRLFADYTRDHVNDYFAIVLDGTVISAPSIREPITSGSVQITMGSGTDAATADERARHGPAVRLAAVQARLGRAGHAAVDVALTRALLPEEPTGGSIEG